MKGIGSDSQVRSDPSSQSVRLPAPFSDRPRSHQSPYLKALTARLRVDPGDRADRRQRDGRQRLLVAHLVLRRPVEVDLAGAQHDVSTLQRSEPALRHVDEVAGLLQLKVTMLNSQVRAYCGPLEGLDFGTLSAKIGVKIRPKIEDKVGPKMARYRPKVGP